MKLIIKDTIFDDFPELVLGIVILHDIDNSQNKAEITEMLRQAESALRAILDLMESLPVPSIRICAHRW